MVLARHLARLVEAINNGYYSITPCFGLIQKVVNLLETAKNFYRSSIPAVKSACAAINQSLIALEQSREGFGQRTRIYPLFRELPRLALALWKLEVRSGSARSNYFDSP
jgi:hypothetical protein